MQVVILLLLVLYAVIFIISLRDRKFGIVLILIGLAVFGIATLNKIVYGSFAANPGIAWIDPNGVPYSNIYDSKADGCTRWQIGGGAVAVIGAVWAIADVFRNRK